MPIIPDSLLLEVRAGSKVASCLAIALPEDEVFALAFVHSVADNVVDDPFFVLSFRIDDGGGWWLNS